MISISGFRLHYFRDLQELRPVAMDARVPMDRQNACPACGGEITTIVTLVAHGDANRIRLGWCQLCGWRGYRDRPAASWFRDFYREEWDNARRRDAKAEAARIRSWISEAQRSSIALAARLIPDRNRPVCEIGCGTGSALKEFGAMGFRNIVGVEPSRFRGEVASAAYGYRVISGAFEDAETVPLLESMAPIGTIYTFHALEHAYDPSLVIAAAARLQREGDTLVVAVPNAEYEAPVMTVFWLPHLHAFTARALDELFHRNGYEVVAAETSYPAHLIVAARRTARPSPLPTFAGSPSPLPAIREHFWLDRLAPGRRYQFSWKKKTYRTALAAAPTSRTADRLLQAGERLRNFFAAHLLGRFYASRSLIMSALAERSTDPAVSALEVHYDGPIELLVR